MSDQEGNGVAGARARTIPDVQLGTVSELEEHLANVRDIAARARSFDPKEFSDPRAFSQTIVEDLATIAEAVSELITRAQR